MSDVMREIFEKEWDLPSEAQGLRFIPELNIYGCDLYKNKEVAERKSSAWFYFQKAWNLSRENLVIKPEWPDRYDYTNPDCAGAAILDCRSAFNVSARAAGVKTK